MEFNETDLIEFFGVVPIKEEPEEKQFFGSSAFQVTQGPWTLSVSFSATHAPMVIADLSHSAEPEPIVHAELRDATAIRVESSPARLVVLAASHGSRGSDPTLEERMAIYTDPLKIVLAT
jgi:hypothetical protein